MVSMLLRMIQWAAKPITWVLVLVVVLLAWLWRGNQLLSDTSFTAQAERNKQELMSLDPQAAAILTRVEDERQQHALMIAAYSASADGRQRSVLADMAAEVTTTNRLPYRARIANIALTQVDLRDAEKRAAFLTSYGTACEGLTLGGAWDAASDFVGLLEQAAGLPNVWPLVRDDPLALVLWSHLDDPELKLLSFYHRNRDWLAEPLASIDLRSTVGNCTVESALAKLAQHEEVLRIAVQQGKLGVYALAVILSHGTLVDICRERYDLDPSEVISVIVLNRDVLGDREGDSRWIGEKASWLATVRQRHPTVWFAAGMTPWALRLHRDAPHVSDALLEKYGADDIAALIYQHFEDADRVASAARAIDRYGDLAIYVLNRYEDEVFMTRLGDYLVDEDIGIRIVPFVIRFGDGTFNRIENDKDWVDRYFHPDGTPRIDPLEWVQYVPGGSALHVARNWAKGYPCEWSEIGWAAVDVADIALTVASFGGSKAVTGPAKVAATGARNAARSEAAAVKGARAARASSWRKALAEFRTAPARSGTRMSRAAEMARSIKTGTAVLGEALWGTTRLAAAPAKLAYRGGQRALDAWKALGSVKRVWIYRGLLGLGLYVTITDRTLPNLDAISTGVGALIGKAAAGAVTMTGDALASALVEFTDQMTGGNPWARRLTYWVVAGALTLATIWFLYRAVRNRRRAVVAGA